jgi:hypothetical protein
MWPADCIGPGWLPAGAAASHLQDSKNGQQIWLECGAAVNSGLVCHRSEAHIAPSESADAAPQKAGFFC